MEWVGNQWIALDVVAVGGYSLRDVRDHTLRLSVVAALWGEDGPVRNKAWHPMATRPPQDPATWPQDQDGVVFMPVRDAVQTGQHPRMFKVKWRQTIDLLWDGSSWLWVEGGARTPAAFDVVLRCGPLQTGRVYELLVAAAPPPTEPGEVPQIHLRLLGHRPDKEAPNDSRTVRAAVADARDPVRLEHVWVTA